jgi:hypothetical protein
MPNRNARQCKDRWYNFLSPEVVNGPWTEEEEALLCRKFAIFGNSWKRISTFFEGRTEINVKSHWQVIQRRLKRDLTLPEQKHEVKNVCDPPPNARTLHMIDIPIFGEEACENELEWWSSF